GQVQPFTDTGSGGVDGLHAQANTALLVDFEHLHLDDIAFGKLVAHLLDALVGDLRNVHESVTSRQDGDEGTEVHQLGHLALVDTAHFDIGRDFLDLLFRGFAGTAVDGCDLDVAIVLDVDGRTGVFRQLADHGAALADDIADLVAVDLHGDDARRPVGHFLARPV